MAGLVPAIHAFLIDQKNEDVDARHKAGHDTSMTVGYAAVADGNASTE